MRILILSVITIFFAAPAVAFASYAGMTCRQVAASHDNAACRVLAVATEAGGSSFGRAEVSRVINTRMAEGWADDECGVLFERARGYRAPQFTGPFTYYRSRRGGAPTCGIPVGRDYDNIMSAINSAGSSRSRSNSFHSAAMRDGGWMRGCSGGEVIGGNRFFHCTAGPRLLQATNGRHAPTAIAYDSSYTTAPQPGRRGYPPAARRTETQVSWVAAYRPTPSYNRNRQVYPTGLPSDNADYSYISR